MFSLPRLIIFLLILLAVVAGSRAIEIFRTDISEDIAASVADSFNPLSRESDDQYVSLLDIIASSLERIKQQAELTASSTDKQPELEAVSSTVTENSPSAPSDDLGNAIVNIFCSYKIGKYIHKVSGTGFLISKNGAVMTNAHVAQYLLLKDTPTVEKVSCEVRVGEDASTAYTADLLYISPTWVIRNVEVIASSTPRGSGENDFAILYITGKSDGQSLPTILPFIPPSTSPITAEMRGRTVILVGYPHENAVNIEKQSRTIATTSIEQIYTFKSGLADIFALGESKLGYQGASGGPVIDHLGRAIGVISTKEPGTTALNAITMAYIDRAMKEETRFDLATTLQGDLSYRAKLFNETVAPILRELLTEQLQ